MSKFKYLATAVVMTTIFLGTAAGVWAVPGTVIGNVKFRYPPHDSSAVTIQAVGQIVSKQGGQFYNGAYQTFEGSVSSRTDNLGRYIFANNPEERINSGDASTAAKNYMYYLCAWLHEDNASGATRCADRAIDQNLTSCINSTCSNINLTAYSIPQAAGYDANDPRFDDECWNYRTNSNNEIIGGNNIGNWCGGNCDGRVNQQYLYVRNASPPSGYRIKQKLALPWSGGGNVDSTPALFTGQNGGIVYPVDIVMDIEPIPIDGVCNSDINGSNQSNLTANSPNLCTTGSVSNFDTTSTGWTWSCSSPNSGSSASCSANRMATCGNATTTPPITNPPTTNLCTSGTLVDPPGVTLNTSTNRYTWTCANATYNSVSCSVPHMSANPAMTIKKYVSSTSNGPWIDAQTPDSVDRPIIDALAPVFYKYVITNTGNVALGQIDFKDDFTPSNTPPGHSNPLTGFACTATTGITLINNLPTSLIDNSVVTLTGGMPVSGIITCTAQGINGTTSGDVHNIAYASTPISTGNLSVNDPAYYQSQKLACQAVCTQNAQCTTNYCSPTTHKCVNEAYPASADCQTPPTNALMTEKHIISAIDTLDGSRTISYMITVKNISITEDVENVQITDDMENSVATGPVTLISGSLYGINLRSAQINTAFNGVSNKAMLAASAGKTNLTLRKYPSSESYASVIYAVTYPLGTRSSASICDKAVVTGTNVISQFGSTANDQKCIDVTATPSPSPSPSVSPSVSPNPTAITPSVTIPPITPTLTPTPAKIDLKLIKSVDKSKVKIGDRVEFTITIANESAVGALNVKVKDLLTSSFAYLSHETSYGQYDQAGGIWTIGNLNALSTQTLKIKALVVSRDTLTNLAEVYQAEQQDTDSTPNNCDSGKNKEDDCADVTLTYDGVVAGITTKGGTLADTGNSLIAPLVFGVLGFGALFIVLKLRSKHTLIIKVSNPGADSAARALLSRLLVHQTIAGGVVIASALLVGVSILNVANTVQIAQLKRATGGLDSSLTMVAATGGSNDQTVTFDCGVIEPLEVPVVKDQEMILTLTNHDSSAHAFVALPGYDVLTQSPTISQQDAADDFIHDVSGEKTIRFVPKTSGTWYLTNASYCKKVNKTNKDSTMRLVVSTESRLASHYSFDDGTAKNLVPADESSFGDGTIVGPSSPSIINTVGTNKVYSPKVPGQAIDTHIPFSAFSNGLTWSAWVKIRTADSPGSYLFAPSINNIGNTFCSTGSAPAAGKRVINFQTDALLNSVYLNDVQTDLNDLAWHHVACVWDPTTSKTSVIVDGIKKGESNPTATFTTADVSSTTLWVGNRADYQDQFWDGYMDQVKIYTKALTISELQSDIDATSSQFR